MASIKINNLQSAGSDLFNDSESYLNELKNQELYLVNGGLMSISTILPDFTVTTIMTTSIL